MIVLRRHAAAALIILAVALSSCGSGDSSSSNAPTSGPTTATGTQPPRTLPVTPVSIDWEIIDPAFDPLPGARALYGTHEGASYQIEVPAEWNGSLVYFAHGFRGSSPDLTVSAPPLRSHFIDNGYAWAASSYSKNGYEPGAGARDTLALQDVVERELGTPERSYVYGQSMGGHVATFSLEQFPQAYDGALTECGVLSGHEILDYFLSWGTLSSHLTGAELYGSVDDAGEFTRTITEDIAPELGKPDDPSDAGRVFADAILHLTGGPRPFFREGYATNFAFNFGVLINAVTAPGPANAAAQNVDTEYVVSDGLDITSEELNREIPRIVADETYRDPETYPEFAPMTGQIERPLLALHTTGDLFVPISLAQSYGRIVDAAGNSEFLAQRAIRRAGHCTFTQAERIRAFDDLVAWVERGERAGGDDLSGDLRDVGRAWTDPVAEDDPGGLTP